MMKKLIISPHIDDEVLGCGGTLYKLKKRGAKISALFPWLNEIDSEHGTQRNYSGSNFDKHATACGLSIEECL